MRRVPFATAQPQLIICRRCVIYSKLGEEIGCFEHEMLSPLEAMKQLRERLKFEGVVHWQSDKAVDTLVFRIIRHDRGYLEIESSKDEKRWTSDICTPGELPFDDYLHCTFVLYRRMLGFALSAPVRGRGDTRILSSRKRPRDESDGSGF